jgi:hypothetical protein
MVMARNLDELRDYIVEQIQQIIEARGTPYQKSLHIVQDILVPAIKMETQKVKDDYEMLMLTDKSNPN